jgi:hypothetical protein
MKTQQLSFVLTVVNLVLLVYLLSVYRKSHVVDGVAPMLRGRGLEIVDDQGRSRAQISVLPPTTFKPTGKEYPETVIFRLIDANGRPEVKIGASEEGGGLGFVGRGDETQAKLEAEGAECSLVLVNKEGKRQEVRP